MNAVDSLAPCSPLLSRATSWTRSNNSASSECACCSPTTPRKLTKRQITVSLSDDDSDFATLSPTSRGSRFSDAEDKAIDDHDLTRDHARGVATQPSMLEQSPIDICETQSDSPWTESARATISTTPAEAQLEYSGHGLCVQWMAPIQNKLVIGGKEYHAIQFHFHTPSEHTLDGSHEAMELHLVHQAKDGSLAVVAVFFREGEANPFLSQFWDELPSLTLGVATTIPVDVVDLRPLDLLMGGFYRYRGSLTTSPYSEGVEWVVMQDIAEASREQLLALRNILPGPNARSVQALNKRIVTRVV